MRKERLGRPRGEESEMRCAILFIVLVAGCATDDPRLRTDIDPTVPPGVTPIVEPADAVPIVELPRQS